MGGWIGSRVPCDSCRDFAAAPVPCPAAARLSPLLHLSTVPHHGPHLDANLSGMLHYPAARHQPTPK